MNTGLLIYILSSLAVIGLYGWWAIRQKQREVTKWKVLYSKEALLRHAEKTYDK